MPLFASAIDDPWKIFTPYRIFSLAVGAALAVALFLTLVWVRTVPGDLPAASFLTFNIEQIRVTRSTIRVRGWALERGQDFKKYANTVVLRGKEGTFALPTKIINRSDVQRNFAEDGRLYERSGFQAKGARLLLPKGAYRVLILHETNAGRFFADTGKDVTL